jgi:hypothetical protein
MVLVPRRYALLEFAVQKKPHNPCWMRGLRFPKPGYALPALSPGKKKVERNKQAGAIGAGNSLLTLQVHSGASCCNARVLSILENSVTCVTKSVWERVN